MRERTSTDGVEAAEHVVSMRAKMAEFTRFVSEARQRRAPPSGAAGASRFSGSSGFSGGGSSGEDAQLLDASLEELRVAEEELRAQINELEQARLTIDVQRQRYEDLFDAAPEAYLVTDRHGILREVNGAAAQELNLPREHLAGKPLLHFVARSSCNPFRAFVSKVAASDVAEHAELTFRPRGGGRAPFRAAVSARGQRGLGRALVAIRWILRPLTEALPAALPVSAPMSTPESTPESIEESHGRAAELALRLSQLARVHDDTLAELDRECAAHALTRDLSAAKDASFAHAAHELRTPMTAIQGWSDLLALRADDEAFVTQAAAVVQRNVDALDALLRDLLDASRVMSGKLLMSVEELDLAKLAEASVDTIGPAAKKKAVSVELRAEPCRMLGDPKRLAQVFLSLLSNAVKFSSAGGSIEVLVSAGGGRRASASVTPVRASRPTCCRGSSIVFARPTIEAPGTRASGSGSSSSAPS